MGETLALVTAVCYGVTHFCSGMLARRSNGIAVACYAQVGGSIVIIVVALAFPGGPATWSALAWGALSGVGTGLGMAFLYRGMGRGKMSVVAPVSDVNAALLPVLVGIVLLGERPSAIVLYAMAAAVPAIWLVSRSPGRTRELVAGAGRAAARRGHTGVGDGLAAGVGIALTWVALERIPAGTGLWPLVVSRVVSVAAIIPLVLATRTSLRVPSGLAVKAGLAGTVGTVGTWLYMLATREQLLAIVSVLSALYPAIPVLLALVFLRERITATQTAGLAIGAAAISIIALN
ncbi:MAG TPA: EamA family transporter [Streptosporangiaceae bacterium]|jgi:drug/metabolite transporter (DMT)-like permease